MRDQQVVALELEAVTAEIGAAAGPDVAGTDRLRGALAALEWALGMRGEAPVSGRLIERPGPTSVTSEKDWAYEVVAGIREPSWLASRAYAGGTEEALAWLSGSDSIPVPTAELEELTAPLPHLAAREALDALYEAVRLEQQAPPDHYDPEDLAVLAGIVDTLEWLLAKRSDCPVLGMPGPVTAEVVAAANEAIEDPEVDGDGSYRYGVSLVLDWASGKSSQVPSVY